MKHPAAAVLALAAALSACRAARRGAPQPAFAPPPGKRAFSLSIDKSQTRFLKPGDAVEAEVLRVEGDWSDDSGLISLALTPEEAEYAALAVDREDRLFLDELPEPAKLEPARAAPKPALEAGSRGLAALVYADQQEFLSPGDRVDVIATRENGKASGKSELAALTLFQDVTVLDAAPPDGDDDWSAVQLSLSPGQAEELTRAIAGQDNLSLAVRAPEDAATRPVEPARMSRKFGSDAERASPKS
jgi:Flp pilus assembly protein CpaB